MGYYEAIKANPKIIYVSLTGYGQKGPYAQQAGHDINYVGYAGITGVTGTEKGGLTLPGVQIADVAGGAYMTVIAALSALWARERTGAGQRVDVSMLDSIMPLMSLQMAHFWAAGLKLPPWQLPLSGGFAFYGIYKCADEKYIALGAIEPKFWKRFCEIIDKPRWTERLYARGDDAEKLKIELSRLFRKRSRNQWMELLGKIDVCVSPVLEMPEIEYDPHLKARNIFVEYEHPQYGKVKGIGMPIKFSRYAPVTPTSAPTLGEHTLQILRELGYKEQDIRDMLRKGAIYINQNNHK
jgi:crotonobetainyl-CoA:carnitine CoA-transferase CaiB-like acyl-CoA transferase